MGENTGIVDCCGDGGDFVDSAWERAEEGRRGQEGDGEGGLFRGDDRERGSRDV